MRFKQRSEFDGIDSVQAVCCVLRRRDRKLVHRNLFLTDAVSSRMM